MINRVRDMLFQGVGGLVLILILGQFVPPIFAKPGIIELILAMVP